MDRCKEKHTKYQPMDEEWRCPKCGDDIYIEDIPIDAGDDCDLLHTEDWIVCRKCDMAMTGKQFAAKIKRSTGMTTCPHCMGKGVVGKENAK